MQHSHCLFAQFIWWKNAWERINCENDLSNRLLCFPESIMSFVVHESSRPLTERQSLFNRMTLLKDETCCDFLADDQWGNQKANTIAIHLSKNWRHTICMCVVWMWHNQNLHNQNLHNCYANAFKYLQMIWPIEKVFILFCMRFCCHSRESAQTAQLGMSKLLHIRFSFDIVERRLVRLPRYV